MLNRREEYTDTMRKLLNDITMEVELFRSKMLAKDVKTVYDNSKEIIFYESVFEYFLYSENISKDVIKTCWTDSWLMENLWKLYLKEEFLTVATWEGIEELLELYATRKRRLHAE